MVLVTSSSEGPIADSDGSQRVRTMGLDCDDPTRVLPLPGLAERPAGPFQMMAFVSLGVILKYP